MEPNDEITAADVHADGSAVDRRLLKPDLVEGSRARWSRGCRRRHVRRSKYHWLVRYRGRRRGGLRGVDDWLVRGSEGSEAVRSEDHGLVGHRSCRCRGGRRLFLRRKDHRLVRHSRRGSRCSRSVGARRLLPARAALLAAAHEWQRRARASMWHRAYSLRRRCPQRRGRRQPHEDEWPDGHPRPPQGDRPPRGACRPAGCRHVAGSRKARAASRNTSSPRCRGSHRRSLCCSRHWPSPSRWR